MNRRAYLGALGVTAATLAGCSAAALSPFGDGTDLSGTAPSGTETVTTTENETGHGTQLDDPVSLALENRDDDARTLSVRLYTVVSPACRDATPPCEMPDRVVTAFDHRLRLDAGCETTVLDAVATAGHYRLRVAVEGGETTEADVEATAGARFVVTVRADGTPIVETVG